MLHTQLTNNYGVKNMITNEVIRSHFSSTIEAQEFIDEWLEDGGKDILGIVLREVVHVIGEWHTLARA